MTSVSRTRLVICSCGWGRVASAECAANAVGRLHRQLADVGTEHVTQQEAPEPEHQAGEQLSLDGVREDDDA